VRLFLIFLFSKAFDAVTEETTLDSLPLSPYAFTFGPDKNKLSFATPSSNTIVSSIAAPSNEVSSSVVEDEELTLPAERDDIIVQTIPQAIKKGISDDNRK